VAAARKTTAASFMREEKNITTSLRSRENRPLSEPGIETDATPAKSARILPTPLSMLLTSISSEARDERKLSESSTNSKTRCVEESRAFSEISRKQSRTIKRLLHQYELGKSSSDSDLVLTLLSSFLILYNFLINLSI